MYEIAETRQSRTVKGIDEPREAETEEGGVQVDERCIHPCHGKRARARVGGRAWPGRL